MKLSAIILSLILVSSLVINGQNLSERLGYDANDRLLILHADDLGVAHSENQGSFDAITKGMVNSASVMVPCPWFNEVVQWAKQNPQVDLGLHLTLTAEWDLLKWRPVAPLAEVPGLVNEQGYFYSNVPKVIENATIEEVRTELRAQIDRAISMGLRPSHLDSHMGSLFNDKFFSIYLELGKEYGIPVMVSKNVLDMFPGEKPVLPADVLLIDKVHMAFPEDFETGMEAFYTNTLRSLEAGVHVLLIHPAYNTEEMQAVTINHPSYGAEWRQQDFDFFTSETCKRILDEENIRLITWKQLGKLTK